MDRGLLFWPFAAPEKLEINHADYAAPDAYRIAALNNMSDFKSCKSSLFCWLGGRVTRLKRFQNRIVDFLCQVAGAPFVSSTPHALSAN